MIVILIVVFVFLLNYYWQRRNLIWLASKLKGPYGYPFIGSAYKFLDAKRILEEVQEFGKTYGDLSKFWMGNRLFVYLNNPDHCEMILNNPKCLDKGDSYEFVAESIGHGLITLKSDGWRFHRKHLNPCFGSNIINSFLPIFNRNMKIFVKKLEKRAGNGPFDIIEHFKTCSMDMVCETTLGMESNTQSGNNMDFFKAAHNVLEITGKRFFQPWIQPHFLFRISKYFPTFNKSVTIVSSFVNKIVERKTNEINKRKNENNFEENDDDDGMRATHKNIFVSQIIKLSMEDKIFTQYDVTSELKTVLLAGYETTATSALSACFLLASYPDVQEKLFEEIHSVFPTQDADVTLEDITNTRMPYLDAVLNECFRFFPVVPFLTRLINEDVVIGDAVIPKGAEVIVDIWGMHRNPSYWKFNASKFNPENFFPENEVPRSKYAFIPFSAGPRICIGKKYGMIAMKLFLIYTVRRFRILTKKQIKDLQFQMQVTIAITNKDIIELELRENY